MSSIARKGLSATLLVFVLAAPVATAAPMEWSEGREATAAAGRVSELVEWVGGWLLGRGPATGENFEPVNSEGGTTVRAVSAADGHGAGQDPNG
jgi:hypothetical protein